MRPALLACLLLLGACTITRESEPPRTAREELLISTAIDRAVEKKRGARINGASIVFVPEVFSAPIATAVLSLISVPMLDADPVRVRAKGLVAVML